MAVRDYLMLDSASAPETQYFLGNEQRELFGAEYRNASSAPVFVKLVLEGNQFATGEIPLGQEARVEVNQGHVGFQHRAPSAPSLLEVRVFDFQ